jgi:hypothetical protein
MQEEPNPPAPVPAPAPPAPAPAPPARRSIVFSLAAIVFLFIALLGAYITYLGVKHPSGPCVTTASSDTSSSALGDSTSKTCNGQSGAADSGIIVIKDGGGLDVELKQVPAGLSLVVFGLAAVLLVLLKAPPSVAPFGVGGPEYSLLERVARRRELIFLIGSAVAFFLLWFGRR